MKKSTLIGISILSVFLLCSLSYQPVFADDDNVIKDVLGRKIRAYFFYIGSIYNLTYEEINVDETTIKIHRFNCEKVSLFLWFPRLLFLFKREKLHNGESASLIEVSHNEIEWHYSGYIEDRLDMVSIRDLAS